MFGMTTMTAEDQAIDDLIERIGVAVVLSRLHAIEQRERALLECRNAQAAHDRQCLALSGMTDDQAYAAGDQA